MPTKSWTHPSYLRELRRCINDLTPILGKQGTVAAAIGVPRTVLSDALHGRRGMPYYRITRLNQLLHVHNCPEFNP